MQTTYDSEVCGFCQELVRQPSLSGQEEATAGLVEREMRVLGYDQVARDELGNVIGIVQGRRPGARVLFDAHMDVVPVTTPEAWRYPPFSGEDAEGRIWGRGTADIKGSLAALVVAVGTLRREDLRGAVIVSASVGEEVIVGLALAHVLERHPADVVVICEPTELRLGLGHKGRAGLIVTAEGRAAHSSRPELGVNAVYRMIEAVSCIRQLAPRRDELLGQGVNELVEIVSSPYRGTSMVPGKCRARFDRRLVRGETRESVLAEMREALAPCAGLAVRYHRAELACYTGHTISAENFFPGWAVSADSQIVRRALCGLAEAGQQPELYAAPYCTNGATSAGELGIPTIIYGAGAIEASHVVDESVSVEQLAGAFRGYQGLARALTQP